MKVPNFRSDDFQRGLARAGTAVWLVAGVALLAATVQAQWLRPAAAPATPGIAAALVPPGKGEAAGPLYEPAAAIENGDELVLVFIGASFCNAQNTPGFPGVVETAKLRVQEHARENDLRFRAVGVALDWRVSDGLTFLARFGEFDEVASGSNWISDGATKYIWRALPGDADVPQIVILQRSVATGRAIQVGEDRVLKRIVGTTDIESWVSAGAKL